MNLQKYAQHAGELFVTELIIVIKGVTPLPEREKSNCYNDRGHLYSLAL